MMRRHQKRQREDVHEREEEDKRRRRRRGTFRRRKHHSWASEVKIVERKGESIITTNLREYSRKTDVKNLERVFCVLK